MKSSKAKKKQTSNTIFFRYSPPQSIHPTTTRKHFETFFSEVGPVKKCSLILSRASQNDNSSTNHNDDHQDERAPSTTTMESKGYGFCKFISDEDATEAAKTCNGSTMNIEGIQFPVWVELHRGNANVVNTVTSKVDGNTDGVNASAPTDSVSNVPTEEELLVQRQKRTSRVIVRNLSFYATEYNVRQVMEQLFGPVLEVTLPLVPDTSSTDGGNGSESSSKDQKKQKKRKQHRGFAFVTFDNPACAQKAVDACSTDVEKVLIKKRPVAIDFSMSKVQHRRMMEEQRQEKEEERNDEEDEQEEEEEGSDDEVSEEGNESDDTDSESGSNSDESDEGDDDDKEDDEQSKSSNENEVDDEDNETTQSAYKIDTNEKQHQLFLRNLPFDATRHDIFTLFQPYGHIAGIYLVKDKDTGMGRGTAFVQFSKEGGCVRALEASHASDSSGAFVTGKDGGGGVASGGGGLYMRGRRILVDLAVDKRTAENLKVERDEDGKPLEKKVGKDKRNLYLKVEGRVANSADGGGGSGDNFKGSGEEDEWENLPESDQLKRGRAHQEKHTKLRSPLFFINPFRLSIRNLAKHVDESDLKALVVEGIKRGLENGLVTREDISAHWRAGGEMSTRDIVQKIAEAENNSDEKNEDNDDALDKIIPRFQDKLGVKKYVPSVYINRDFQSVLKVNSNTADDAIAAGKTTKAIAPSRGFGFVEFTHHAHAIACLRELNNNPEYSAQFVAGGKKAIETKKQLSKSWNKKKKKRQRQDIDDGASTEGAGDFVGEDGKVRIPRLIVEFTVENKAKAKKQVERRAQQLANVVTQKAAQKKVLSEGQNGEKKKKKSRGALQREKKRKRKEKGLQGDDGSYVNSNVSIDKNEKKQKIAGDATSEMQNGSEKATKKIKSLKPQKKKKKVDKEEAAFEDMVQTYKTVFSGVDGSNTEKKGVELMIKNSLQRPQVTKKRWFD